MVPLLSLTGILAGWLLMLVLGVTAGYGLVVAWQRWGERLPLPTQAKGITQRVLGPAAASPAAEPTPANAPTAPTPPPAEPAPQTGTQGATVSETPPEESAPPEGEAEEETDEETPTPPAPPEKKTKRKRPETPLSERELELKYTLDRADAIEEISVLFDTSYEQASALLKSGLWGMENHEEWARAMREKQPPAGVPEPLFRRIVNSSPKDYQDTLAQLREKRVALKQLQTLWGVGPQEAEALFEAGFRDLNAIRNTSTDKLAKTPGIGHALAFQIRAAAHGLAPTA